MLFFRGLLYALVADAAIIGGVVVVAALVRGFGG
jgi:hypothetical protein